jgi:predicted acylesterase/phospholipase RssA
MLVAVNKAETKTEMHPDNFKRPAVVLSGGGFNGAFQAGAIEVLWMMGIRPAAILGVSVGALNGALWAQDNVTKLSQLWEGIKFKDIFGGNQITNALFRDGLYSNKPLRKLLDKYVDPRLFRVPYYCGVVDMRSEKYFLVNGNTFTNDVELIKDYILASTSIPVFHTLPVIGGTKHADGGVRNPTPIGDVLSIGGQAFDSVIVINCQPTRPKEAVAANPKGIIGNGKRALSGLMDESFVNDINTFKLVNEAARLLGGSFTIGTKTYHHYPYIIIEPKEHPGSGMDADRTKLNRLFQEGGETVLKVFES